MMELSDLELISDDQLPDTIIHSEMVYLRLPLPQHRSQAWLCKAFVFQMSQT